MISASGMGYIAEKLKGPSPKLDSTGITSQQLLEVLGEHFSG